MANIKSAKKRAKQNVSLRTANAAQMSALRTVVKKARAAIIGTETPESAAEAFKAAQAGLDSKARKGLIHPNKAARLKSRLSAQLKAKKA